MEKRQYLPQNNFFFHYGCVNIMSAFEELGLCPELIRAVEEDSWLLPTAVQTEAIPPILGGRDLCVAAETGSGKTGAFGLPCLQVVHEVLRKKAVIATSGGLGAGCSARVEFNNDDKDLSVCLSEDGSDCACYEGDRWRGVRATVGVQRGKSMFEACIKEGRPRLGWSPQGSSRVVGTNAKSFGYGFTGKKSWNNTYEPYGPSLDIGDIVGCLIDRDNQCVSFALNGQSLGVAYEIPKALSNTRLYPTVCGRAFSVRCCFDSLKYPFDNFLPICDLVKGDSSQTSFTNSADVSEVVAEDHHTFAIVLEPTKDLAMQVYNCFMRYAKYLQDPPVRVGLLVGGIDENHHKRMIREGIHIVIGTLPKVMDCVRRLMLDLSHLRYLILDEADELLSKFEKKDIFWMKHAGKQTRIQTLLFSATLHGVHIERGIQDITIDPLWVDLKGRPAIPDTVHCVLYDVNPEQPLANLTNVEEVPHDGVHSGDVFDADIMASLEVKRRKPQILVQIADKLKMESCLVFCRTNLDCDNLEKYLTTLGGGRSFTGKLESGKENPYSCVVLAGMRSVQERIASLKHFKDGDVRFLICTDVAARGIDIQELPYMVMLNLPDEPDQFFHRVGRVGRADRMGLAISIASLKHKEKVWYHKCANRGKGCSNTKLISSGGCTTWYDEGLYNQLIEEKTKQSIPIMDPISFDVKGVVGADPAVPSSTESGSRLHRRTVTAQNGCNTIRNTTAGAKLLYGKMKGEEAGSSAKHVMEVSRAVDNLKQLEGHVQKLYVSITRVGCGSIERKEL